MDILDKIGMGKQQYILLSISSFQVITDGLELTILSVILPAVKEDWNLTPTLIGILGSIVYLGMLIGNLISGVIIEKIGSRKSIIWIAILQAGFGLLSAIANDAIIFIIFRFMIGLILGFAYPLFQAIVTEIFPKQFRGKASVLLHAAISIGNFLGSLIAFYCLSDISHGKWRLAVIISALPPLCVVLPAIIYVLDSPRIYLMNGKIDEGIRILEKIAEINGKIGYKVEAEDVNFWRNQWDEKLNKKDETNIFAVIFSQKFRLQSWLFILITFSNFIIAQGISFIIPFELAQIEKQEKNQHGLFQNLLTTLGELIASFIGLFMIDNKWLGRKQSLVLVYFIAFLSFSTLQWFALPNFWFVALLMLSRFACKMGFLFVQPYIAESQNSLIRTKALGIITGLGRIGCMIIPYLSIELFYIHWLLPLLVLSIFAIMGSVSSCCVPFETKDIQLDIEFSLLSEDQNLNANIKKQENTTNNNNL